MRRADRKPGRALELQRRDREFDGSGLGEAMQIRLGLCLALLACALTLAGAVALADPPILYGRVDFGAGDKSPVWLSFQNNRLRIATSQKGLETATPVRAKTGELNGEGGGSVWQNYQFPEVDLPVKLPGLTGAKGTFTYMRSRLLGKATTRASVGTYMGGEISLLSREADGTTWGYTTQVYNNDRSSGGDDPKHPAVLRVPRVDPKALTFTITVKMEGRKARIGMQPMSGKQNLENITRNGKATSVTLEVTDKDGKVIVSEKGDPKKFGFT